MSLTAHLDVETRSEVDLKTAGLHRYFEDPTTEVLVVRWRLGDGPVGSFKDIAPFVEHVRSGGRVTGHNIPFDRECWNTKIAPFYDWPEITVEQTDCTQARCAALAVPQGLDGAGKALGANITKDAEGHKLMMRMCRPKRIVDGVPEWHETSEQLARLSDYCGNDVLSECEIDRIVPQLSEAERKVWLLDQKINARGVRIDTNLVDKALDVAEVAGFDAANKMWELTDGEVQKPTQTARLVAWLNSRGIPATSVAKGEVDEVLIRTDLFDDAVAREVVELRRASAKSSVAKYRAMQRSVCSDSRVRGTLAYHGASTGRWAGRLVQFQNLPRIGEYADDVKTLHRILVDNPDARAAFEICAMMWSNPLEILSRALRSMIEAERGHRLIGADYSNIEGRVNAWLSGEKWKVKAFADFDAGIGHDLYVLAYARAFGLTPDQVGKVMRQIGKVMELSMGYQGGKRAFHKMGANHNVSVSDERAEELKDAWREAHPNIKASWYELQDAGIEAVKHPGMKVPCLNGRIKYLVAHDILWCLLPSGRTLSYVAPYITNQVFINEDGEEEVTNRPQVAFWGVESTTKKWARQRLYGGLQCENVVQGIARDVMVEGMFRLEEAGYPIILTVHDEVLTEVRNGFGDTAELAELMAVVPEWAEGLPVAVAPWEDQRYVK